MNRTTELKKLSRGSNDTWDIAIIGGGASGLGIAVDAASRGLKTVLFEKADFAKGTSSKSTKLVHGGVRYLAQGNISLVFEALHERGILARNAPHLVHDIGFVIPAYRHWNKLFYGMGMKVYDLLAGRHGFAPSRFLDKAETLGLLSNIATNHLRGGVLYHDGQFDDARLAVNLAQTASASGACLLNYVEVTGFHKTATGAIDGLSFQDNETGATSDIKARCVINATGVFVDHILQMDTPGRSKMVAPSQGSHIVVDAKFMPGNTALMIPKTSDGRVLFAVPWHNRLIVGTTDVPAPEVKLDPRPTPIEIAFILQTANRYLDKKIESDDVKSVFAGQRPLAAPEDESSAATKEISRSHKVIMSRSGLITIIGGKWTTYRRMAEDTLKQATVMLGTLPPCKTKDFPLHGSINAHAETSLTELNVYGSDQSALLALVTQDASLGKRIHPNLPISYAQVVWAFRHEMARTVEDVLARRTRCILLDARASVEAAAAVAAIGAQELHRDIKWQQEQISDFASFAKDYIL